MPGSFELAIQLLENHLAAQEAGQALIGGRLEQAGILEYRGHVMREEVQQLQLLGRIGEAVAVGADEQEADQPLLMEQGDGEGRCERREELGEGAAPREDLRRRERLARPFEELDPGIGERQQGERLAPLGRGGEPGEQPGLRGGDQEGGPARGEDLAQPRNQVLAHERQLPQGRQLAGERDQPPP
jgi:hypothetical protein